MSKTLSKILVICAMAVIFPLMIVGTAFASFYSIDATTVVEVYAGAHVASNDAFAQVQYGDEAGASLTITEGHLKDIQIKALSNGYDFVGWYEGTVEQYLDEETPAFVCKEAKLEASASDYANLVAVFEIKSYTFSWSYISDPENSAEISTTAPQGSKEKYYWGDALPVLSNEHFDFNGWTLEGDETFYSAAKFENSGEYSLNAGAESWTSHGQVAINYYDDNGVLLETETVYKGTTVALKEISSLVSMQDGYEYSWKDSKGSTPSLTFSIPREYEAQSFNFYLNKNAVVYTANLAANDVATYNNSPSIDFTVENSTALEALFVEENWNKYSFHEIAAISYNEVSYTSTQVEDIVAAVVNSSKHSSTTIEIEIVMNQYFTTFVAKEVGLISSTDAIYQEGESIEYAFNSSLSYASTGTLEQLLSIKDMVFVNDNEDNAQVVDIVGIRVNWTNGGYNDFSATRDMVLNDLIESILSKAQQGSIANADEFVVESLSVVFA